MVDPAGLARPPAHPRRLVYLGTPEIAVPPLVALHDAGFEVALVVTGADKRRGRRSEPSPTPVKLAALALGLAVTHDIADITQVGADLGVVVAYGAIVRRDVLVQVPMVNLHFSSLPRWRGAAPVERAVLAGDPTTGVCVMAVEEGLDTGGVHARTEVVIRRDSTAPELAAQLTELGSRLLVETLQAGLGEPEPQTGTPTYAHKLEPKDRHLDWHRSAEELHRVVRVGGAWTAFRGKRLKVHQATVVDQVAPGEVGAFADGVVRAGVGGLALRSVQPEGKAAMTVDEWVNGARPRDGEVLGGPVEPGS